MRSRAFTLFEMILSVSLLALMAGLIAPTVGGVLESARIDRLLATRMALVEAAIDYYADTLDLAREDSRASPSTGEIGRNSYRTLSRLQSVSGWDGPYIDHPIQSADNPFDGDIAIHPDNTADLPAGGFDLDGDGVADVTGPDLLVFYAEIPQDIAQQIDERLDASVGGTWSTTGQVQYKDGWIAMFGFDANGL